MAESSTQNEAESLSVTEESDEIEMLRTCLKAFAGMVLAGNSEGALEAARETFGHMDEEMNEVTPVDDGERTGVRLPMPWAMRLMIRDMARTFRKPDGSLLNFVEIRMVAEDGVRFSVTFQREDGETPVQQKEAAIASRDRLSVALDAIATHSRGNCGHLEPRSCCAALEMIAAGALRV